MGSVRTFFTSDRWVWLALAIAPLMVGAYSVHLGQDVNWDNLNYHLYNPYAFLNGRLSLDLAPAGLQTYFNPFLDVAYFQAAKVLSPKAVGFALGLVQGLNFIAVYGIARALLRANGIERHSIVAFVVACCGLMSVGFLSEIGTTLGDSVASLFPLTALWIILEWMPKALAGTDRWSRLVFAGIVMGFGCGLKLVVAIYALPLCIGFLLLPVDWRARVRYALLFGFAVLVGAGISGGYWFARMWIEFGNPLFPQYNHIFHGELAQALPVRDVRFLPQGILEKIFYPFVFTSNPLRVGELRYKQVSWVLGYVALVGALFGRFIPLLLKNRGSIPLREASTAYFVLSMFLGYALWLNTFGIYRYLIPLEVLIPLLLVVVAHTVSRESRHTVVVLVGLICLSVVSVRVAPDWGRSSWSERLYRVEENRLLAKDGRGVVFLAGQPLGWLAPALDIPEPFVQLDSNLPTSQAYVDRARAVSANLGNVGVVILENDSVELASRATRMLEAIGQEIDWKTCDRLVAYLGSQKHSYPICRTHQRG